MKNTNPCGEEKCPEFCSKSGKQICCRKCKKRNKECGIGCLFLLDSEFDFMEDVQHE